MAMYLTEKNQVMMKGIWLRPSSAPQLEIPWCLRSWLNFLRSSCTPL